MIGNKATFPNAACLVDKISIMFKETVRSTTEIQLVIVNINKIVASIIEPATVEMYLVELWQLEREIVTSQ